MPQRLSIIAGVIAVILASLLPAEAASQDVTTPFMAKTGTTTRPLGYQDFCKRYPKECREKSSRDVRIKLTSERWDELVEVNSAVNRAIRPVTDLELFGEEEYWDYPQTEGDCEDFVLLKRRILRDRGWPAGSVLITVARQQNGEGHAVLTVLTDRGDLVLDNLDPHVKVWSQTDYLYVKRQSEFDSGRWVALDDARIPAVGSLSR